MLTDVKCPVCEKVYQDKILFSGETVECPDCNVVCDIVPSISAHFRLKYDNRKDVCSWASEGYASSQYYSAQKKMCKGNIFTQK